MLYRQGENWIIAALRPMPPAAGAGPAGAAASRSEGALKTTDIEVRVDPRAEWKQMYREAWRIERDCFYDPRLPRPRSEGGREEVRALSAQRRLPRRSELPVPGDAGQHHGRPHARRRRYAGGEARADRPAGRRLQVENGRYRFARVYNGENWNPQTCAPLTQPGVNVKAGEYLLAVNGRDVRRPTTSTASSKARPASPCCCASGPIPTARSARSHGGAGRGRNRLRNLAWIEENRRKVDQMTERPVAYIYMPDTANGGYTSFNRYFFAQVGQGGRDHRRALQRRRPLRHRHRRVSVAQAAERR